MPGLSALLPRCGFTPPKRRPAAFCKLQQSKGKTALLSKAKRERHTQLCIGGRSGIDLSLKTSTSVYSAKGRRGKEEEERYSEAQFTLWRPLCSKCHDLTIIRIRFVCDCTAKFESFRNGEQVKKHPIVSRSHWRLLQSSLSNGARRSQPGL